jgi:hypothetical protein
LALSWLESYFTADYRPILGTRIIFYLLPTFAKHFLEPGWLSNDPRAARVIGQQARFAQRLEVFDLSFGTRSETHVIFGFVRTVGVGDF